jgi:ectoine hydroxylase-related dioxygenase (phytanoyl-CoA dioxygenase family)
MNEEIDDSQEVDLTARAGDVIFFHSRLLHATGPNTSTHPRYSPIISYMPGDARFVGRGRPRFRTALARATA